MGIPLPYWCGQEGDYNCLVMELLGETLAHYKQLCGGKFSLKTVLMVADQLVASTHQLSILEYIHSECIIHRDLKLENILLGVDSAFFQVHLIDFGLSKRFIDPQTNKHILKKSGKTMLGSIEFASLNNHSGKEISRRDDLESCGYIFIQMLVGELPWSKFASEEKAQENESRIFSMKQDFAQHEVLRGIPAEFGIFLESVKKLAFEEEPKYLDYRRMFKELMIREGFSYDYIYDWILVPVSAQIEKEIHNIDELLQIEDSLTKDEEREIAALISKYEQDPTVIDYRLEEIRKQNKKFDVISPNASPRNSLEGDPKNKDDKRSKSKGKPVLEPKEKKPKKDKDCSLI